MTLLCIAFATNLHAQTSAFTYQGRLAESGVLVNGTMDFEFRLFEGSNNGLGIRAPLEARDVAYDGIELQIIDNGAERYRDIQPWQKHGSLYHVFPAKTGHLKPVGAWNEQEIRAEGTRITVTLNGHVIVDADLTEAAPNGQTVDGQEHPGLFNEGGAIGFLGHGHRIEFRDIRIQEL